MGTAAALSRTTNTSALIQWTAVLLGPVAWALDLGVSYAAVKMTCSSHALAELRLVSAVSLTLVAVAFALSWRLLTATPETAPTDGGQPMERLRFMALLGLFSSAFSAAVVVAGAIPRWILDACA